MIRSRLCAALCLFAGLLCAPVAAAQTTIQVNEAATHATLEARRIVVSLAVNNPSSHRVTARVKLELLDTQNRVQSVVERDELIKPGATQIALPLVISTPFVRMGFGKKLFWYRLRYQFTPGQSSILALSEITRDLFELSLIYPGVTRDGEHFHVRVRAAQPLTERPAGGVRVACDITPDDAKGQSLKATAVTGPDGFAVFDFDLPRSIKTTSADITARGERNGFVADVRSSIMIDTSTRIAVSTDKPLYQPGQTLHLRALTYDPLRRAVADGALTIRITDPEDTVIYRTVATTSRFGVASADWVIPENVRLGDYEIRCRLNDADEFTSYPLRVRISRYDLPNYAVTVKPDRAYYLRDQNAEVVVRGDYLFGQPLPRGHVRVVRETSRQWNFREQKWEIEEEDKVEGELDQTGRFVARIDLKKAHGELAERDYRRFRDVSYIAYVTDPTTGRTEQRRFDLRVTKEPIHVYVIGDDQFANAPLEFYVSAFYADGTPAECEVTVREASDSADKQDKRAGPLLRMVRTNRYGVAKVSRLTVGGTAEPKVAVTARDRSGAQGYATGDFYFHSATFLRVETDRAIYRPGQPIQAHIISAQKHATVMVDVANKNRLIRSQQVALRNGEGRLTFAYTDDFQNAVTIAAYVCERASDTAIATRTVLYPHDDELKLDVKMRDASYRPGDEATAVFSVHAADDGALASALGVAVVDRAVDERARTDIGLMSQQGIVSAAQQILGDDESIAGITLSGLNKANLSKPIAADVDLVAEILMRRYGFYYPRVSNSKDARESFSKVFGDLIQAQTQPIEDALNRRYARTGHYPASAAQLARTLNQFGIDFAALRDPWDTPYRAEFAIEKDKDVLRVISAGADKRFATDDDFAVADLRWPYFSPRGKAIDRALHEYHARTGRFVRDRQTLRQALLPSGIDFNALRDRWNQLYEFRFGVSGQYYTLTVASGGPNRRFARGHGESDDFTVWFTQEDYFADRRAQIDAALTVYFKAHNRFPQTDVELSRALAESNIARDRLRDGWNRPAYATFKSQSRYGDRVQIYSYAQYGEQARQKTEVTPVTQFINYITLRSAGEDGKAGTADDFDLGNYSRVVAEQTSNQPVAQATRVAGVIAGQTGALTGVIVDPQGAAIPGVKVKATHSPTLTTYDATTDGEGRFLLSNLPAGFYELRCDAAGFSVLILSGVPVQAGNVTAADATLEVSMSSETVTVSAAAAELQTASASVSQVVELPLKGRNYMQPAKLSPATAKPAGELSTPRLREYFPETLVWQPSIETDEQGRASLKFKLADNITTWRLAVVASTVDGRIGTAETDVLAFQPFFIEHDPPRVLTEGDEISLPVVLRNYLDRRQTVALEFSPAAWFAMLGPSRQQAEVNAGDAARVTFDFRAAASVKAGPQRVTASSSEADDAIEKKVTVHPDGEEIAVTASQVFGESTAIVMNIPDRAIPNTTRGELKIYPNLSAHVLEAIEAIMQRPYGCAEQTISSAYTSLLALELYEKRGDSPIAARARRYVQSGYERLLSYRDEAGGFSYWGRGAADTALTAYAIQFLNDAARFISVDEEVLNKARDWLIKQQRADGRWPAFDWRGNEGHTRTAMLTATAARALAQTADKKAPESNDRNHAPSFAYLNRALDYLSRRAEEIDEPYLIASFALAAMDAHQDDRAGRAVIRLTALAHTESDASYWSLETNTPFYGWGLAGRVETTALAIQALASRGEPNTEARRHGDAELINRGLIFLLRQKDRYGVWYSTQATVQTLKALAAVLSARDTSAAEANAAAEIIVNGKHATSLAMPGCDGLANPFTVDLSSYLSTGSNLVEIRRAATASQASAQLVTSHYERWSDALPRAEANAALRLKVTFDKTDLKVGDEVTCRVEAERVGFRGYGMMLAEIGLPPGADVDRTSMERAMTESGWDVSQYDVLPDRVVVYLWPKAGGTRFTFKFKPRYGLKAQTAPFVLYDYYNPEARVTLAPVRFLVR